MTSHLNVTACLFVVGWNYNTYDSADRFFVFVSVSFSFSFSIDIFFLHLLCFL